MHEFTSQHIAQLSTEFPDHSSFIIEKEYSMSPGEWESKEFPHVWRLVEESNGIFVYVDSAYTFLVAFDKGEILGYGARTITTPTVVVMDAEYYGVLKYIWR